MAAAGRLGISRPAVAKRVGNLEALAGHALLNRGGRGVRLTDAGATLLSGARRMLDERDVLLALLTEIRGEDPSPIAGLRGLLGHSPTAARAAQRPEARLAETERVLELVLRASATGMIVSDPATAVVHEVNDAFCRFTGRSRAELLSEPASASWYDSDDRERLIEEVPRSGAAERVVVRVRRPDGSLRVGETTSHLLAPAGTQRLLSTVDDITEQHQLQAQRTAGEGAYRAVTRLAARLLGGDSVIESVGGALPELRRSGEFETALLWDARRGRPLSFDGEQPPHALERELLRARPVSGSGVLRISVPSQDSDELSGWALALAASDCIVILLGAGSPPGSSQELFPGVLAELAAVVSASAA